MNALMCDEGKLQIFDCNGGLIFQFLFFLFLLKRITLINSINPFYLNCLLQNYKREEQSIKRSKYVFMNMLMNHKSKLRIFFSFVSFFSLVLLMVITLMHNITHFCKVVYSRTMCIKKKEN